MNGLADLSTDSFERIDRLAVWALRTEVSLYPKAGLVSCIDNGSHSDMNAATFFASATALEGYFSEIALAGANGARFHELNAIGRRAEARMFEATNGINTHRGAVFSLGLLSAAAGACLSCGTYDAATLCNLVARRWGPELLAARPVRDHSHGAIVRARYGAPGAREEAAAGFPTVLLHALPAFRDAYLERHCLTTASLHCFYAAMAILDDNNLLYRGGPEGLELARSLADDFILKGGMLSASGRERAVDIHRIFVSRRLSPGGSADLLIATLFLAAFTGIVSPP